MRIFHSEDHRLHFPQAELSGGQFVTPFERPSRVEYVLNRLRERKLTDIRAPEQVDMKPVRALLDPGYLRFLETAWDEWKAAGMAGEIIAANVPARGMHLDRIPEYIDGKVGYYSHASETAITQGTWAAALSSVAEGSCVNACVIVCLVPPTRPPRHCGSIWRLLLYQQCRNRRRYVPHIRSRARSYSGH